MLLHGSFLKIPNKFWEFQTGVWKDWTNYFDLDISWTRKCDHAGFRLYIELCGLFLNITIYDNRHWDDDEDEFIFFESPID